MYTKSREKHSVSSQHVPRCRVTTSNWEQMIILYVERRNDKSSLLMAWCCIVNSLLLYTSIRLRVVCSANRPTSLVRGAIGSIKCVCDNHIRRWQWIVITRFENSKTNFANVNLLLSWCSVFTTSHRLSQTIPSSSEVVTMDCLTKLIKLDTWVSKYIDYGFRMYIKYLEMICFAWSWWVSKMCVNCLRIASYFLSVGEISVAIPLVHDFIV